MSTPNAREESKSRLRSWRILGTRSDHAVIVTESSREGMIEFAAERIDQGRSTQIMVRLDEAGLDALYDALDELTGATDEPRGGEGTE